MKSKRRITPYIFSGFFICLLLVLGSFKTGVLKGSVSGSVSKKQVNVPVQSRVSNVTFIDSTVHDNGIEVSFRNDSPKTITAVSVLSGGVIYRSELLDTTSVILPGATFSDEVGLPKPLNKGVFLGAVVYEDGTTSGEPEFINQILDARAGKQAQLQRLLPILEDGLVASKNVTLKEKWRTNTLKIQNLPNSEEGKSFEYNAALQNEKNLALMKIKEFEQIEQIRGEEGFRKGLIFMKEEYERKSQILRSVLKDIHR
jgi:hypothetical protein